MSVIDFYILYIKMSPFFNRSNISENIDAKNVASEESDEAANSSSSEGGGES